MGEVRTATSADIRAVAAIYGEAVRHSVATFDLADPPAAHWQAKLDSTAVGDHVLVLDVGGEVTGFAYSGAFRPRPAYAETRETTIYLRADATGQGLGRRLYTELLRRMTRDGVHLAVAAVAQPNDASNALHEGLGYTVVGTFTEVGRKFDRWVDTRWYQRLLGPIPR